MHKDKKSHPIAESTGAAGGAVAGMAAGAAIAGPAGAVIGAAAGAVAGGMAGHAAGVAFDPKVEDAYWRDNYRTRPYVKPGSSYDEYRDAYRYGGESRARMKSSFDEASNDLEAGWEKSKANSKLAWHEAKDAVRDGWHRVERAMPGDADRDGR